MSWIRYELKRRRLPKDIIRLSNSELRFSKDVWKKYFKKSEAVGLMFDPDTNQVGLVPCDRRGGFTVFAKGNLCKISWGGFLQQFNLLFEKSEDYKIQLSLENKTMVVISLNRRGDNENL